MGPPIIHIAHAGADARHVRDLSRHLIGAFGRAGATIVSADTVSPGTDADATIKAQLIDADAIVLVVSAHFFTDELCSSVSLPWALARHRERDAVVIAIRASSCVMDARLTKDIVITPDGNRIDDPELWWFTCASTVRERLLSQSKRRPCYEAEEHRRVGEHLSRLHWFKKLDGSADEGALDLLRQELRRKGRLVAGDFLDARFRLLRRRSSALTTEVWEAYDRVEQAEVLVHVLTGLSVQTVEALRLRIEAVAGVDHPAIVRVLPRLWQDEELGFAYYVTELVRQRTLLDGVIDGSFHDSVLHERLLEVVDALRKTHAHGVVHGDVGPHGVFCFSDDLAQPNTAKLSFPLLLRGDVEVDGASEAKLATARAADVYGLARTALFCVFKSVQSSFMSKSDCRKVIDARDCGPDLKALLAMYLLREEQDQDADAFASRYRRALQSSSDGDCFDFDLQMVDIAGGTFWMGAAEGDTRARPMERPRRLVSVSSFRIGKYPVTQRLYRSVMHQNPSAHADDWCPVHNVSFNDAILFCNELSRKRGLRQAYRLTQDGVVWICEADGFRLLTEAEWELAARGPDGRVFPWGDSEPGDRVCWKGPDNSLGRKGPSPVWSHPGGATPEGVCDMIGNVWEWCWDRYFPYRFWNTGTGAVREPAGARLPFCPDSAPPVAPPRSFRVLRGGAWNLEDVVWMRASIRSTDLEDVHDPDVGFRIARGPKRGVSCTDG